MRKEFRSLIVILFLITFVACFALSDNKSMTEIPSTATENQNWVIIAKEYPEEIQFKSMVSLGDGLKGIGHHPKTMFC